MGKPAVEPKKWYRTESVHKPLKSAQQVKGARVARLRRSIKPGTVLVLLAGRYAGTRVVFLKQLDSGLLLITGPFCINGIPLRRVDQRYVLATSTCLSEMKADVSSVTDAMFKKEPKDKDAEKKTVSEEFKTLQKAVDKALMGEVEKLPYLRSYLKAKFALKSGDKPHEMTF